MKSVFIRPLALAAGLSALAGLAHAGEIRVMCYQDGIECEVTAELAKRFEAQNPGTKVVVDNVPYKTIVEQLPVQLAAGQGPDIARVTDLGGLSKYYMDISAHLKNRKYWDDNFGATAPWLRPSATDKGIYGFMSQLTMTGPFVNKTLFEQAKVPMPGAKATWDDWMEASRKVAKATQIKAAAAWDRSGHRFAGPAISYGAKVFDAQGRLVREVAGEEGRHYPDTDELHIDQITFKAQTDTGQHLNAVGHKGIATGDGQRVTLLGDARAVREATADLPRIELRGEKITALIKQEKLLSSDPVQIMRGSDVFTANNMDFDITSGQYQLTGRVRGTLAPASTVRQP